MSHLEEIQRIQSQLLELQMRYRDTQPEFYALALAWESVRVAWYVCADDSDTANEKIECVKSALDDLERQATRAFLREPKSG